MLLYIGCLIAFQAAAIHAQESGIDTVGTKFVAIFPTNNFVKLSQAPELYLDFINVNNNTKAEVTVSYNYKNRSKVLSKSEKVTVDKGPNLYRYNVDKGNMITTSALGLTKTPFSAKISITSDKPISVVAHNFFNNVGDSYSILPTSAAGYTYSFSLPASNGNTHSRALLYFFAENDVSVTMRVFKQNGNFAKVLDVKGGKNASEVLYSMHTDEITVYATADKPFQMVAAVRFLAIKAKPDFDFGCFMPLPFTNSECKQASSNDVHLTDLKAGNYYAVALPRPGCQYLSLTVQSMYENELISEEANSLQSFRKYDSVEYGDNIAFVSNDVNARVVRLGGGGSYDSWKEDGAFLDNLPSISEHVTGLTGFTVYNDNDEVTIFGDKLTSETSQFDGESIPSNLFKTYNVCDQMTMAYYTMLIDKKGFHQFYSQGQYILHISGSSASSAQGYTPRLRLRKPKPQAPTTTLTSNSTLSTVLPGKNSISSTDVATSTNPPTTSGVLQNQPDKILLLISGLFAILKLVNRI